MNKKQIKEVLNKYGIRRINKDVYEAMVRHIENIIEEVGSISAELLKNSGRSTLMVKDINLAFKLVKK